MDNLNKEAILSVFFKNSTICNIKTASREVRCTHGSPRVSPAYCLTQSSTGNSYKMADEMDGEEICNEDEIALKVAEYLDDVVGTNVDSLSKVKSLMDSTLKKEKELKKRVSKF